MQINRWLGADVFDASAAVGAEAIETQAIDGGIDLGGQSSPKSRPLSRIDFTLKYGVLDSLAKIETGAGHAT